MMWQTQTTIEYPFALRPASIEEAGLFYSQMDEAEDAVLGTVGHIRMDFGASGKEFYHTWWPHNGDQFNTGEFKDELQKFVDMLRSDGPLTNLASMRNYCYQHGGKITEDGRCFGYIAETEHYRYCLRCTPSPGEYQGYLYSYDLRQQRMAQQAKPVGRITYASGEEQTFTDAQKYLDTIREELPYQATTGFRYETLTDDPAVRKAVDDILLDFAGEENPRRGCNYGLTEAGKQALQEAADPDRPHTYAWFVMTDCNIPGEQIYRERAAMEELPVISRLLEADARSLDRLQVQMATAREFFVLIRFRDDQDADFRTQLSRVQKSLEDQGFKVRLAGKEDAKRMLGVYFEQNATTEKYEDFDGERWIVLND